MDGSFNTAFTSCRIHPASLISFPSFQCFRTGCGHADYNQDLDSLIASYILFGRFLFLFRRRTVVDGGGGGNGVTTAVAAAAASSN